MQSPILADMHLFSSFQSSSSWAFYLGLVACTGILQLTSVDLNPMLEYNRIRFIEGEYWRVLSGHFVHLSWYHWFMNMAGILLIAWVLPPTSHPLTETGLSISLAFGVGFGLYWIAPDLIYYVGLSGLLHGLFVTAIWRSPYYSLVIRLSVLALVIAKMVWEFSIWYDPLAQADQLGGRVEIRAHLIGVILGFAGIVAFAIKNYWLNARQINH